MPGPLTNAGLIQTLTVGGFVFADASNIIHLGCVIGTGTNDNHSSFRKQGTSTGYAVTSGKTLKIRAFSCFINAANALIQTGYGDTSVSNSVSAPTNAVYDFGSTIYTYYVPTVYSEKMFSIAQDIPATKIPFARINISGTHAFQAFGYEV